MLKDITPSQEQLERLEKALDFSNTMQTFNLNKNNLKVKTQNLLSYSTNGGTFNIDQSLIGFMYMIVSSGKKEVIVMDKNDIPIKIENTEKFLEDISSLYFEAINEYYNDYQKLKVPERLKRY